MKRVQLVTDGACLGNPGPGGWAAILRYGRHKKEIFGSSPHTTNNRMELAAAIEGLRAVSEPCEVEIVTDSEYLKKGITEWIHSWKRRGWRTASKHPVVNRDLWESLDRLVSQHKTTWTWTRGHASHADNNRADELATAAARDQSFSETYAPGTRPPSYDIPPKSAEPGLPDGVTGGEAGDIA
jgi:ribonuclease HI